MNLVTLHIGQYVATYIAIGDKVIRTIITAHYIYSINRKPEGTYNVTQQSK